MNLQLFELVGTRRDASVQPLLLADADGAGAQGARPRLDPLALHREGRRSRRMARRKCRCCLHVDKSVADSWVIANYLEDNFPDRPSLVRRRGRPRRGTDDQFLGRYRRNGGIFPLIVADIPAHLGPVDADYFRTSREARLGRKLEEAAAERDKSVVAFRRSLEPMRTDAAGATFPRRRGAELCRLHRVRRLPMGARGEPVQAARRRRSHLCLARKAARCVRWTCAQIAGLCGVAFRRRCRWVRGAPSRRRGLHRDRGFPPARQTARSPPADLRRSAYSVRGSRLISRSLMRVANGG